MIKRKLIDKIIRQSKTTNKIVVIYGPRQIGKTTLAKSIIDKLKLKTLHINADQTQYIDILSSRDWKKIKSLISGYELLFIDEAQRIPEIGINLKIIYDNLPEMKIITTGSSSFDLANKLQEPLTGRKWTFELFPISIQELENNHNAFEIKNKLEELLVYGAYPEVLSLENIFDKQKLLMEISRDYLYKDILDLVNIKYPHKLRDLLRLISFQIGSEVSISELADNLGINKETVENYIDLLEKSFVIFRLSGFSRNLRNEVKKMNKIFFYDLGIRNVVIDNLKPINNRDDVGALWENFLIIERFKYLEYNSILASTYFWRMSTGAEIDYVEERDGMLYSFEFKWNPKKQARVPQKFLDTYKNSEFEVVNRDNFLEKFLI